MNIGILKVHEKTNLFEMDGNGDFQQFFIYTPVN